MYNWSVKGINTLCDIANTIIEYNFTIFFKSVINITALIVFFNKMR
jgi:hypothetical protein